MSRDANNNGGSSSTLTGPGMPGTTSQIDTGGSDLPQQVLAKECLDIVNKFKSSNLSKSAVLVSITEIITAEIDDTSGENISNVAAPYFTMLDHWESEQEQKRGGGTDDRREPPVEPGQRNGEDPIAEDVHGRGGSVEPEKPARKRAKLDFSFVDKAATTGQYHPLSANLKRTNEILTNWSQDQKEAHRQLMYHEYSPEFHESGWAEIVAGKCINLDVVHTIIASCRSVDKQTETIGGVEIRYGTTKVTAKKDCNPICMDSGVEPSSTCS